MAFQLNEKTNKSTLLLPKVEIKNINRDNNYDTYNSEKAKKEELTKNDNTFDIKFPSTISNKSKHSKFMSYCNSSKNLIHINNESAVYYISKKGTKDVNQDSLFICKNIFGIDNYNILSVFDGHGHNGHFISELSKNIFMKNFTMKSEIYYVPRMFPFDNKLAKKSLKNIVSLDTVYSKLKYNKYNLIKSSFEETENQIKDSDYESDFSGTTACFIFIIGKHLICGNVGDSRAVLYTNKEYKLLSKDHKPTNYLERERILKCGGTIKQKDFIGPFRVYVRDQNFPGLAMSRSLGDEVAKSIGVSSNIDFINIMIEDDDKFIVIASDGLWEYLSNEEVGNICRKYSKDKGQLAVQELLEVATNKFLEIGEYIDDISIGLFYF